MDLTGTPIPAHLEGESIAALLLDPTGMSATPALTTFGYNNHAVRNESWRYIRYSKGEEEVYNDAVDPLEWTNLAGRRQGRRVATELRQYLPTINHEKVNPVSSSSGGD